jgi:hypothetical protein
MVSQLIVEDETEQRWVIDPTDSMYESLSKLPDSLIKVPRSLLVDGFESPTINTALLDQKDVLNDDKIGEVIKTHVYNYLLKNGKENNKRRLPSQFLLHVEGRVEGNIQPSTPT